ncbi:unnamed protein product [Trichobilharzia regenti]|nr:unnamed protein product [Trichobilharzia regenti]
MSALHVAAFIGGPEIVQLLIQNGALVNQATMRCETALHLAVRNRQVDVAETLIYHGASVNAKARPEPHSSIHVNIRIRIKVELPKDMINRCGSHHHD